MSVRVPDACPHRFDSKAGTHHCQLINQILGSHGANHCQVDRDICSACCRSFLPTVDDLNPVLASLIWTRTGVVLNELEVENDSALVKRLEELRAFAEASLPLLDVDDDDLPILCVGDRTKSHWSADEIARFLPVPKWSGRTISEWAIGVTSAPRRQPTLDLCVTSLCDVGWKSPHLFIDGDVELSEACRELPRTLRSPAAGAWKNFYLSLMELTRRSTADGLMLVQDDALWPSHLSIREYLERIQWPGDGRFIISPYCCSEYTSSENGWRQFETQWHFGAVAFIFSRSAAEEFLSDSWIIKFSQKQEAGIDAIVGEWASRNQVPIFVPTPSLVQHIGDISTLWRTSRASGFRRASRYIGDEVAAADEETESS